MTLYKILKSRKGISPILATLLLIVIAVAAIIVTYAWVMTYMGTQTNQAGALIDWENAQFYGTPNEAAKNRTDIVIVNKGTSTVKIARVYMGTVSDNLFDVTSKCLQGINATINPQERTTITIAWPITGIGNTWINAQTYYFKVATDFGTPLQFSCYKQ